ncbi:MAG: ComF family protein [Candidatus Goldbacteria bacterium]|nr:ComF family protein [Candidatus Goldiibacteriota bacterium]
MNLINGLLSLFYPTQCGNCKRYIKDFKYLYVCPECFELIKKIKKPVCEICSKPLDSVYTYMCLECVQYEKKFKYVKQAGIYDGALKELIHLLKFYGKKRVAEVLFKFIIENIEFEYINWSDLIVPVPLSKKVLKERGFNQTEIIGRKIANYVKKPFLNVIKKIKETQPQNKLSREERMKNLHGAFNTNVSFKNKKVLIIDDVYTTGATMNEMAEVLLKNGALEVRGLTVARSV